MGKTGLFLGGSIRASIARDSFSLSCLGGSEGVLQCQLDLTGTGYRVRDLPNRQVPLQRVRVLQFVINDLWWQGLSKTGEPLSEVIWEPGQECSCARSS